MEPVNLSWITWLAVTAAVSAPAQEIAPADLQRVYEEVKTPFKYGLVLRPVGDEVIDCPSVFRARESWFMMYVVNRGKIGYETCLAESPDLLPWTPRGTILPFAQKGWDAWQGDGAVALVDPAWDGGAGLQRYQGKYWMTFIGGARQGYEPDPLAIGVAWTADPTNAVPWVRYEGNPVLSVDQPDVRAFEARTLYKSQVIWDQRETLGAPFVMFYNGEEQGGGGHEKIGMAVSRDMLHWQRYGKEPVIANVGA